MRRFVFVFGLILSTAALFVEKPSGHKESEIPVSPVSEGENRRFFLSSVSFNALEGWKLDKMLEALPALKKSCTVLKSKNEWRRFCADLNGREFKSDAGVREFLERRTRPFAVNGRETGLFTGYYEPVIKGSLKKTKRFSTPLWGMPEDIVKIDLGRFDPKLKGDVVFGRRDGKEIKPYLTRKEIETGKYPFPAEAVAWVEHPVDAFMMQIQGSGRLQLPNGKEIVIGYAGNNGHKFVGIGALMAKEGLLKKGVYTMSEIKAWLKKNPKDAERLMHSNPRFIFFRRLNETAVIGSLGVPLTPKRSLAVDPSYISLGSILWLETTFHKSPLNRLMAAQDTGNAIKGAVRGDFFWGNGEDALKKAGSMRSEGTYFILVPVEEIENMKQKGIIDEQAAS